MNSKSLLALFVLVLLPVAASAQSASDQTPQSQGPMRIERVHSGLLAAPDFKVTDVDYTTSEMVGGYAGWITDDTFFVGGGVGVCGRGSCCSPAPSCSIVNFTLNVLRGDTRIC